MFKRLLFLLMALVLVVPVLAQNDDNTPTAAIDAALTAVEEQVGSRAGSFTFQFLGETTDSSLGCALVQGEELSFTVEAVLVTVIYPDAQYITYSSISGQVVVLCDQQFSEEVLDAQLDSETECTVTPLASLPAYAAPNITVDGVFTAGTEQYRVYGVSSDGGWYQIAGDLGLGWVEATSVTIAGNCDNVPTTSITNPVAEGVCFVEPQGGFTNVRSTPEGDRVGRIYENQIYQATARNTSATWFYIQPAGWVSNTVIFQVGDCTNITVNDNAVGVGFADIETGEIDTDAAIILERFPCPADFAGYLPPRITVGQGTAQVEAGGIPNTLRGFPSVDDAEAPRIGTIQPQRVIDRVISGPVCNQGFVWWLVEIDGVAGWTAESNQSSEDYFLEPTGDAPIAETALDTIEVGSNPIQEVMYNSSGSRLFALTNEQGFGDGELGVVIVFDGTTGDSQARVEEPTGIVDIDYAVGSDDLMVASGNGTVTLYNATTLEQTALLTEGFSIADQVHVEIMPDSSLLIVAVCTDETCSASQINTVDIATGSTISGETTTSPVIDLNISDDGSTVAVVTANGVSFHAPDTLALISNWDNSDGFGMQSVTLNTDGSSALFAGCNNADCSEGRIGLLSVAEGNLLGIVPSHMASATAITYNADATRFVTVGAESGDVIERSATTGEATESFALTSATVVSLTYTTDGNALAVGMSDGQIVFLTLSNQ